MDPNEDPEARIRDLERPLADRAQTSELGIQSYPTTYSASEPTAPYTAPQLAQQYYPPPPPPPPGYGPMPYGMPPTVPAKQTGVLAFVAIVLAMAAAVAGVLIWYATSRPADGPVVSGGGGPLDQAPQIPSVPSLPVLPSGIPGLPSGFPGLPGSTEELDAGPGETVSVSGVQTVTTVHCDDGIVTVSGVANVVTITGRCATVSASGVNNAIAVDESAEISASGFDNRITYKSGTPQIGYTTDSNTIEQGW